MFQKAERQESGSHFRMGLFSESELASVEENQLVQGNPQCAKLMLDIRRCLRKGCVQSDILPQVRVENVK